MISSRLYGSSASRSNFMWLCGVYAVMACQLGARPRCVAISKMEAELQHVTGR
jgi:hypothetical protein